MADVVNLEHIHISHVLRIAIFLLHSLHGGKCFHYVFCIGKNVFAAYSTWQNMFLAEILHGKNVLSCSVILDLHYTQL